MCQISRGKYGQHAGTDGEFQQQRNGSCKKESSENARNKRQ